MAEVIDLNMGSKSVLEKNVESLMIWARAKDAESNQVKQAFMMMSNQNVQLLATVESLVGILVESKVIDLDKLTAERQSFIDGFIEAQEEKVKADAAATAAAAAPKSDIWVPKKKIILPK